MKVAYINHNANASIGKIVTDIVTNCPEIDAKFYFGDGDSMQDNREFSVKVASKIEWYLHIILTRLTGVHGRGASYFVTRKLIKELKRFNPDILHLQNLHEFYVNYEMLFKYIKRKNFKVVWTFHDCWNFTGGCTYYDFINCQRWKDKCKKCPQGRKGNLRSYLPMYLCESNFSRKKKSFQGVENLTIVCPSKWLANEVEKSFLKEYSTIVINNGVNCEIFKRYDSSSFDDIIDKSKTIVVAVASSWTQRKGYKDIIEVSRRLPSEFQVVIVGVNEQQLLELNTENIVAIKRTENQKQLAELYSLAKVFINPTYEETFGMVNIEALACGCPAITYNTGGSIEPINTSNGQIVEKGNIDKLIDSIYNVTKVCYNKEEIAENIHQNFSAQVMAEQYLSVYKKLLEKQK